MGAVEEHKAHAPRSVRCAVITISDSRTEATDESGALLRKFLAEAGHRVGFHQIVKDDARAIGTWLTRPQKWRIRSSRTAARTPPGTPSGAAPVHGALRYIHKSVSDFHNVGTDWRGYTRRQRRYRARPVRVNDDQQGKKAEQVMKTWHRKRRGGTMTAAKRRPANSAGGRGRVRKRPAGRNIMKT